jgi:hypothetical protein
MEQRKKGTKPPFFRNNPQGHPASRELKMIETRGKIPRKPSIQCWGCGGYHMYRDCPRRGEKVRTIYNVQQDDTMKDMGRNVPRIYAALDNKQVEFQSHMIEVESKINNQTISILIDLGDSHIYIYPKMVERLYFPRRKHGKSWLVQLAIRAKRKINEMVKACPMDMNGLSTREYLNILPLGSYEFLIGMDWLDQRHAILYCYNKEFTLWDKEGNLRTIQGNPRAVIVKEISALQPKKSYRKECQIFATHMEETPKDKVSNIEYYAVLKEFKDVSKKILGLHPKRDIDFSINPMLGVASISNIPYRISTP